MRKLLLNRWLLLPAILLLAFSCGDDGGDSGGNPVASFQFEADDDDFLTIHFTNFSRNADEYSWDFGDGNTSTEEDPSHTYDAGGSYTVELTVTGNGKTATKSETVVVTDPGEALLALTGEESKSWKLLRDASTGVFPLQVGNGVRSQIWWSFGGAEQLGVRPCMLNDEFIFSNDGTFEYKTNGDFWAEGMVLTGCQPSLDANYTNAAGTDLSAWNSGVHEFEYNAGTSKLKVIGDGAFVGLNKVGTGAEVTVPQDEVEYNVVRIHDGAEVDTLILEVEFTTTTSEAAYWRFVLVHYDNQLLEPAMPGAVPLPGFTFTSAGATYTFTNTSTNATTYLWDFGDGQTSTAESPSHTYTDNGIFPIKLTATSAVGSATAYQYIIHGTSAMTAADLHGGGDKVWKLKQMASAYRVGPANEVWFANPFADVAARACMFDDEFIFSSDMGYEYDANGQIFAEPYINGINFACTNEGDLTGVFAGFKSNANHTFTFTPASGGDLAKITVNGTGAFIGFSKAYNDGEYQSSPLATSLQTSVTYEVVNFTNGATKDHMEIRVKINDVPGWWSFMLVSE